MPQNEKTRLPDLPTQHHERPGTRGRASGPAHTEPLIRNAEAQRHYGPGTYGNDQFAAEHHEIIEEQVPQPEGLDHAQKQVERPTTRPKDRRYGRTGADGKG